MEMAVNFSSSGVGLLLGYTEIQESTFETGLRNPHPLLLPTTTYSHTHTHTQDEYTYTQNPKDLQTDCQKMY